MKVFCLLVIVFCIFMLIKNEITYRNHNKTINAIDAHWHESHNFSEFMRLMDNMESYRTTLFRLWDFGCENILPKEDYEIIKPYIEEKRNENSFR